MTLRTRFAPSPTGSLHVGGARTALYCLLLARHHGGKFLLRIEDTDRKRSTEEAAVGILRDLQWLGLQWDEGPGQEEAGTGPYFQSERLDLYGTYFDQLIAAGVAYEAWESSAELMALREAARAEKKNFRYRQRTYSDEELAQFKAEGRVPVLRLKAPAHDVIVDDKVLGEVKVAEPDLEDIVIRKADGFPTYHFAVVIDDHHMGVTDVLRGQEHLMNTPKHLGLYEALSWTGPRHAHLPLIFNPGGSKMSKRDKAKAARAGARDAAKARAAEGHDPKDWTWLSEATGAPLEQVQQFMKKKFDGVALAESIAAELGLELPMIEVMDFRKGGYLPEALLNYLALLGWSAGDDREILSMEELIATFTVGRINKTAAKFDVAKLTWMNGEYLRAASNERLLSGLESYLEVVPNSPFAPLSEEERLAFLTLYRGRFNTYAELDRQAAFFFHAPTAYNPKAVKKHLLKGGGVERLLGLRAALEAVSTWDVPSIQAALEAFGQTNELGMGKIAQPLRIALTGNAVTPSIYETLALMPQGQVLTRISACHEALS